MDDSGGILLRANYRESWYDYAFKLKCICTKSCISDYEEKSKELIPNSQSRNSFDGADGGQTTSYEGMTRTKSE